MLLKALLALDCPSRWSCTAARPELRDAASLDFTLYRQKLFSDAAAYRYIPKNGEYLNFVGGSLILVLGVCINGNYWSWQHIVKIKYGKAVLTSITIQVEDKVEEVKDYLL